ncbi:MAG TPA: hypothetical protein VMT15_00625, partial [Bryobacteraceae bacterium]|nr:hypothetical protein [Bryobacteraceae bacterium]
MKLLPLSVVLVRFLAAQTATLEDFQSTRFGYSSSYPLWSAYTGPGAGDNLCTTQTWTITGGFGVD